MAAIKRTSDNGYAQYVLFVCLLYQFIFQDWLQRMMPPFQYFDEMFAASSIPIAMWRGRGLKLRIIKNSFLLPLVIFMAAGLAGSLINRFQPAGNTMSDLFLNLKFWLAIYVGYHVFGGMNLGIYADRIYRHCSFIVFIYISFFLIALIATIFSIEWVSVFSDRRYGFNSIVLFYSHPSMLSASCLFLLSVVFALKGHISKGSWCIAVLIFFAVGSLRTKDIAACASFFTLYVFIFIFKRKFTLKYILILLPLIILIGWHQIEFYFVEIEMSARNQLTVRSFNIARDFFPFGTGFATYGSAFSTNPYSPVYWMYSLNTVHGLMPYSHSFVSDTFWPMILGQTGFIGLAAYVVLFYRLFRRIQTIDYNSYLYVSALFIFFYMAISSTSSSAFVHYSAVSFAFITGVLLSRCMRITKEELIENYKE